MSQVQQVFLSSLGKGLCLAVEEKQTYSLDFRRVGCPCLADVTEVAGREYIDRKPPNETHSILPSADWTVSLKLSTLNPTFDYSQSRLAYMPFTSTRPSSLKFNKHIFTLSFQTELHCAGSDMLPCLTLFFPALCQQLWWIRNQACAVPYSSAWLRDVKGL